MVRGSINRPRRTGIVMKRRVPNVPATVANGPHLTEGNRVVGHDRWQRWQTYVAAAGVFLALVASIFSIALTYRQIATSANIQREASGRSFWMEYIKYNVEKPAFVCPRDGGKKIMADMKSEPAQFDQYVAYTEFMLGAFENILDFVADDNDAGWTSAINNRLGCHAEYLSAPVFLNDAYCTYSKRLRASIGPIVTAHEVVVPKCATDQPPQ